MATKPVSMLVNLEVAKLDIGEEGLRITKNDQWDNYAPSSIAAVIFGLADPAAEPPRDAIPKTNRLLSYLQQIGVEFENIHFVNYTTDELASPFARFSEAETYRTACDNPAIDTDILDDLEGKELVLIGGLQSYTNIVQFCDTLFAHKKAKDFIAETPLKDLEEIVVLNSITATTKSRFSSADDTLAKYNIQRKGGIIAEIYADERRIC